MNGMELKCLSRLHCMECDFMSSLCTTSLHLIWISWVIMYHAPTSFQR